MFEIVDLFSPEEFLTIKRLVTLHVKKKIPALRDLSTYHTTVTDNLHSILSPKRERVLGKEAGNQILKLHAITRLLKDFSCYQISNIVYDSKTVEDRPEFYFRLVRPHAKTDVGTPHCDFWFDEAMRTNFGRGNTIKLWIPIVMEPGRNGLLFYPTNADRVPYIIKGNDDFRRPVLDCEISELGDPILPKLNYGQALSFSDDVLHCGAINQGSTTRVSLEITLVKRR